VPEPISSMQRFLAKLRDLVWDKLTSEEQGHFTAVARGHAGGHARAERMRAEQHPEERAEARKFPYDRLEQLPAGVKGALPEAAQKVWLAAFNSADKQHPGDEAACARIAWGAVKSAGYHPADGGWKKGGEAEVAIDSIIASVEASRMGTYRLLGAVALADGGKSVEVQIFPKVGTYQHPRYGELKITPEFLQEVKRNFDAKVYQQDLPLTVDLEHQSSLSGAAGWISKVEVRGDGAFATIDLNDRGQELVSKDAYRYFSPEYYDKWVDPATNKEFANLLIGGALTNRPFFKGMRPVAVMSEGALAFAEPAAEEELEGAEKQVPRQRDDGVNYPAAAFLYVPDPEKPSTWKVRIWDSSMKPTRAQLGAAAAAFSPGGFRGNPVQMPAADRAKCIARLKSLYSQLGVKPDEMPAHIAGEVEMAEKAAADPMAGMAAMMDMMGQMAAMMPAGDKAKADAMMAKAKGLMDRMKAGSEEGESLPEHKERSQNMGMTEEEAKRLTELETAHKTLTERLAAEETARKAAEAQATAASEKATRLERDANRRTLTEEVRLHRLGYRGEVDAAVDRLEAMQSKLSVEEFAGIVEDAREVHSRFAESDLLKQTSRPGPLGGVQNELGTAVARLMSEKNLSEQDAIVQAVRDNPRLYAQADAQHNRRARMGGD